MYLYEGYEADAQSNNGTTARRLSVIEITSILSVTLSAAVLIFHVWTVLNPDLISSVSGEEQ